VTEPLTRQEDTTISDHLTTIDQQRLARGIPAPTLFEWNRPFFAAGTDGKLVLQRCTRCRKLIYYPRILCPFCLSTKYEWETLSGRGSVYSFAIVWRPNHPAFAEQVPIILAVVDLSEGVQMVTTLVGCAPEAVEVGMQVNVVFDTIADGIALPKFEASVQVPGTT
jgi:uncharacterized OB-fold protein